jgi:Tol biopolymer transport system component
MTSPSPASRVVRVRLALAALGLAAVVVPGGAFPAAAKPPKTTSLVSVNAAGDSSGDRTSGFSRSPGISADGRYVVFTSRASDLVANDANGLSDVFVRDMKTGTTTLVSVNAAGTGGGNGFSSDPSISADGRRVAFVSAASDLVAGDTNGKYDVFVRDLKKGTTTLVSVNKAGTGGGDGDALHTSISGNGRYVAFSSVASDLVANDTNGKYDVFVRDLKKGTTTLVSVNAAGTGTADGNSIHPSISANGRLVAFESNAEDLVGNDSNGFADVFVRDLVKGVTTLVSANGGGTASGDETSSAPAISGNGRFVAFASEATDLVANDVVDTNGVNDIFVRDLKKKSTVRVSVNASNNAAGSAESDYCSISANGRFVAFESYASDLVAGDANGTFDAFVRDLKTKTTKLVSVNSAGTGPGNFASGDAAAPAISANSKFVAFSSLASDLTENDFNSAEDVFRRAR